MSVEENAKKSRSLVNRKLVIEPVLALYNVQKQTKVKVYCVSSWREYR
jgi:hypothetical protein